MQGNYCLYIISVVLSIICNSGMIKYIEGCLQVIRNHCVASYRRECIGPHGYPGTPKAPRVLCVKFDLHTINAAVLNRKCFEKNNKMYFFNLSWLGDQINTMNVPAKEKKITWKLKQECLI